MAVSTATKALSAVVAVLALAFIVLLIVHLNGKSDDNANQSSSGSKSGSSHPGGESGGEGEPEAEPSTPLGGAKDHGHKDDDGGDEKNWNYEWEKNIRLPRSVVPKHYDLYLYPDLNTGLFMGRVDVHVESKEARDHFHLHVLKLDIQSAKLFKGTDKNDPSSEVGLISSFEHKPNEFFVMRTNSHVDPGNYIMAIEFRGNLTDGIVGFYQSVYTNAQGQKVPIATSKFQPTHARKAFPCFDEPSFKSTFTVTLVRPTEGYIALSNMPVDNERDNMPAPGYTTVKFKKSVPMVTYLACFIVCDFAYQEKLTAVHKTKFRVYATPNQRENVKYALDIGANITDFFEDYFEIPYPLPKQDMIAIPDFVSGAMEHWGLITYRETTLLFDPKESASSNQQRVASVVSHELAHQWFGNLVTLSWWDDLWLNEGFASYMEYKGVTNYHDDWEMDEQFLTSDLHRVMDLDATINSHPIVQPVENPDQITEIFDTISYSKGASVLRMLEDFMGKEFFRIGVSRFLEKYKYDNAVTADLWSELSKVAQDSLNITRIMDTWTRQMGLPVLTVEQIKPTVYRLTQDRFLLDPSLASESDPSPYGYRWEIPLTWVTDQDPKNVQRKWMRPEDKHVEIQVTSGSKWVKFNIGQYGYYRVKYPKSDWLAFSSVLKTNHEALDVTDRASLLNDAFSLAESGHLDYSVPLSMVQYLRNERGLVPWRTAASKLADMEDLLRTTDAYPMYRKYMLSLIEDRYNQLGWSDEGSHAEKLSRVIILSLACRNGHQGCLQEAGNIFDNWIDNASYYISPNLRSLVYKYGMESRGDASSWQVMLERFMREQNAQEKKKLLYGLANAPKPWILSQFLRLAQNETIVRSQDYFTALRYIASNPIGTPLVWNYLRDDWSTLVSRFSLNNRYLGRLPGSVTASFNTKFQLDEMKAFFAKYPDAGAGSRSRKQALENVENNIKWLARHKGDIYDWLLQNPTQK